MKGFASTLAIIWRLALPYFKSEERWPARALLASVVVIELAIVWITVLINHWNARFYNALQERNWDTFVSELIFYCMLATAFIILAVYQLYLNQWLQIRWRRWLTTRYLGRWLDDGTYYRMQLLGDAADNPDQRITEDVQLFVEKSLTLGLGLLGAVVTLGSFVAILWVLSVQAPLRLFGSEWTIPGYLVWAALIYALVGTLLTHLIGRALIRLNFMQQRYEADFRFNLVRVRENAEQIALIKGEPAERVRLMDRFGYVVRNWFAIMTRQKRLVFFTAGYGQVSAVFPILMISPAYFAGSVQLGGLMQTASAFGRVEASLSFFITSYRTLAEWRAVIERLAGFDAAIEAGRAAAVTPPVIQVEKSQAARGVAVVDLDARLPNGTPLVAVDELRFEPGDRVLITGPSGSGKTTLFRTIGGIWPFGTGTITMPSDARVMFLPQRPYLPVGTLHAAVSYPSEPEAFDAHRLGEVLIAVGLAKHAGRLSEDGHWNRTLSLGEQQRLGLARAMLHKPDFLFLDEATASLDEPSEAALYRLLREQLPDMVLVSIGHRSTLKAFHDRHLTLVRDGERHRIKAAPLEAAAE